MQDCAEGGAGSAAHPEARPGEPQRQEEVRGVVERAGELCGGEPDELVPCAGNGGGLEAVAADESDGGLEGPGGSGCGKRGREQ